MIRQDSDVLDKTLRVLLGLDENQALPFFTDAHDLDATRPAAVIAINPSDRDAGELFRAGYTQQKRFALLPSRFNLRWLLPQVAKRRGIDGLQIYMPHGHVGRLVKALIVQARATGWQGWVRDTAMIASTKPLPIEKLLCEVTGEKQIFLSLSPGTPGAYQKLTVQAMRHDGSILGYLKLPMTMAADARLRNEAAVVEELFTYPELRAHIPRLLFAGSLQGRYAVLQSPLEGKEGPRKYDPLHELFLERLHRCRFELRSGSHLVDETAAKWNGQATKLDFDWQALGREALRIAAQELEGSEVPCGIAHGDFAPWNTRIAEDALRLFDWESACWNAPLLWDKFHFMTQTECLLHVRHGLETAPRSRGKNRGLYLLYLLDSARQFWAESAEKVVIQYRRTQLEKFIAERHAA